MHFEIPTKKVVISGKEFILKEFPAKKFNKWMSIRLEAMNRLDGLKKDNPENEKILEELSSGSNEVFRIILGDHVSDEWMEENLTFSIKQKLIEVQDELCNTADMLGNVKSLLQEKIGQ